MITYFGNYVLNTLNALNLQNDYYDDEYYQYSNSFAKAVEGNLKLELTYFKRTTDTISLDQVIDLLDWSSTCERKSSKEIS